MKFSDYYEENNKKKKSTKNDWVGRYDFDTCHLISEARLKAGLTQKQLADLVGTQQPNIARAESGSFLPGHNLLKKIALAIKTPLIAPRFNFLENIEMSGHSLWSHEAQENVMVTGNFPSILMICTSRTEETNQETIKENISV